MQRILIATLATVAAASSVPRADDPSRYTICGADRGYTEKDSLEAAEHLRETIVTSDKFFMAKDDCIYSHKNTTIVSLCNGAARDRHVNRNEVRRGINQLIKDCGLEGGFTGVHVVNNLTFAAYGIFGGKNLGPPPGGSPPPDVPGGTRSGSIGKRSSSHGLVKRDPCASLTYNGVERRDCAWKNALNPDGSCGQLTIENNCEAFCEIKRIGLIGLETHMPGKGGDAHLPGVSIVLENSKEYSITNGFSIGVEGVAKEVIGAGLSYQWSFTKTVGTTVGMTYNETAPQDFLGRWVFFPKLIHSCGSHSKQELESPAPPPCSGDLCTPPTAPSECVGEVVTTPNACSLSPALDDEGNPSVFPTVRWEHSNGSAVPLEQQTAGYKQICNVPDPDGDGQNECYNTIPTFKFL